MQYHALALAVNGVDVDLIGEQGLPLPPSLAHPRITVHRLRQHRVASIGRTPFVIRGGWEALSAAVDALRCLFRVAAPDAIVTQTPPAVPTLVVAWIASRCRGARLVFDWHNLAWTLLAARPGTSRLVIGLARAYERRAATLADAHLCVSSAAATFLTGEWALSPVHVLRDRPAEIFAPQAASAEMRRRLARLAGLDESTRPALALSPTGFTRDEDLDLILAAADDLEARWREAGPAGGLVIAVSGEGPGRKAFERRLEARTGRRVWVVPTWVAAEEYPSLVASADVGVCVHRSSSCVDLPMKIADLFGSGVPVCALDYGDALREMVTP
ncbi:MAG TPA: glycosyltransferase, partial [Vicinamibacterales bacterium]|nr:glycosyltransferase [Vicinamibacterales bacterium]